MLIQDRDNETWVNRSLKHNSIMIEIFSKKLPLWLNKPESASFIMWMKPKNIVCYHWKTIGYSSLQQTTTLVAMPLEGLVHQATGCNKRTLTSAVCSLYSLMAPFVISWLPMVTIISSFWYNVPHLYQTRLGLMLSRPIIIQGCIILIWQ